MSKTQLIGANRFREFNFKDRVSNAAISDFEHKLEKFAEIPTIANGWLVRSPSSAQKQSQSILLTDGACIIRSQSNVRQVRIALFHLLLNIAIFYHFVCKDIHMTQLKR